MLDTANPAKLESSNARPRRQRFTKLAEKSSAPFISRPGTKDRVRVTWRSFIPCASGLAATRSALPHRTRHSTFSWPYSFCPANAARSVADVCGFVHVDKPAFSPPLTTDGVSTAGGPLLFGHFLRFRVGDRPVVKRTERLSLPPLSDHRLHTYCSSALPISLFSWPASLGVVCEVVFYC